MGLGGRFCRNTGVACKDSWFGVKRMFSAFLWRVEAGLQEQQEGRGSEDIQERRGMSHSYWPSQPVRPRALAPYCPSHWNSTCVL